MSDIEKTKEEILYEFKALKQENIFLKSYYENDNLENRLSYEDFKKSEEKYRILIENSHDIIYTLNSTGIFTFVSPAWTTLLGHNPEEVVGHSFQEFVNPDDIPLCKEFLEKVISTGLRLDGVEYRTLHKDGRWFWHTSSALPLTDTNGKISGIYGIARDITERKLAKLKLEETEAKLNTLFGVMTEMVALHKLVLNEKGEVVNYRIIDCNDAFTKITGIKKEDAIGKLATDVYQIESAPYLEEYTKVALSGIPYEYTTYYAPMDKHFMISVVSPSKNNFATITTDISAIKQIQEVISNKNKELENYLFIASHDLRSPLVNIQGFSQRLQKHANSIKEVLNDAKVEPEVLEKIHIIADEEIPKTLKFIYSNATKMDTLINGLLKISRTGRLKMTIKNIQMEQLLLAIIKTFNFQINDISAKVNLAGIYNCFGDENQLNQLFSNIIGNAIKYRDKSRQLIIDISSSKKYNKVIYCIKDNGIGIAERHLEKIWNVFYRVNSSSQEQGEGIGLSIAKRITDKHKGKIWAKSEEGKGTSFFIELLSNEFQE